MCAITCCHFLSLSFSKIFRICKRSTIYPSLFLIFQSKGRCFLSWDSNKVSFLAINICSSMATEGSREAIQVENKWQQVIMLSALLPAGWGLWDHLKADSKIKGAPCLLFFFSKRSFQLYQYAACVSVGRMNRITFPGKAQVFSCRGELFFQPSQHINLCLFHISPKARCN